MTSRKTPVRFDAAMSKAVDYIASRLSGIADKVVLVRDIYGRLRVVIDDRQFSPARTRMAQGLERQALHSLLGPFSPGADSLLLLASEMFAPDEVFLSPDISVSEVGKVRLLDRQVMGSDWTREPFPKSNVSRIAFYGVKGGVGRSTAAAVLAWRMASAGQRVLVIDLDLESPGLGTTLLPVEREPEFGIVDWFVEDAVGQADDRLVAGMLQDSPLASREGEVIVAPASGRKRLGYSYLPKLARCYADLASTSGSLEFGGRVDKLVRTLEKQARPDITILDSRAGLHDIAAVAVTRLNALSLLFAIDTSQSWRSYELLFQGWHADPAKTARFRTNLQMVAALVPETDALPYLERFTQNAYGLFEEYLYEEDRPRRPGERRAHGVKEERFNFDIMNTEAPHYPVRINWTRAMQEFDPVRRPGAITEAQIDASFEDFVEAVYDLALARGRS